MIKSSDFIRATSRGGQCRFSVRGDRCVRLCLLCDAEFEQTDDGLAALRAHEFLHGIATLFDWAELDGKNLRMVVVRYETDLKALYSGEADLYAVDDEQGVIYHLSHERAYSWQEEVGGWKWKIGKPTTPSDGLLPMPHVQELRLLGSKSTVEK